MDGAKSKLLLGAGETTRRKRISANALKGFFCVLLIDLYQARVAFRINGFRITFGGLFVSFVKVGGNYLLGCF